MGSEDGASGKGVLGELKTSRPIPYEHRGREYRDLLRNGANVDQLENAYRSEGDRWLKKILAEGLRGRTRISPNELEALIAMNVVKVE
jgi:hypothetical protein